MAHMPLLCVHDPSYSCSRWCFETFCKCFVVGSVGKTLLNVAIFLAYRKGRTKWTMPQLKKLIDVRFGLFLATFSGGWKAASCLTRALLTRLGKRRKSLHCEGCSVPSSCCVDHVNATSQEAARQLDHLNALSDIVAGGVAGLSLFFLSKEERKGFALYSLVRSCEFICKALAARNLVAPTIQALGKFCPSSSPPPPLNDSC